MNLTNGSSAFIDQFKQVKFDGDRFMSLALHGGKNFPEVEGKKFISDHFIITLQASVLYVLVVFGTKFFMRNREPFSLFVPLNIWNFLLAAFSIIGTIKMTPEFVGTLQNHGVVNSYCYVYDFTKGENGYWVWLFIASKLFELVDTVFLVLRKRPLMFLHWYHHILTLIYAWFSHPLTPGFNRYGIYLNFLVHAFMYSYYFLRSMKIWVPGVVAKFVTTIQIVQFLISCGVLAHVAVLVFLQNVKCDFDINVFYLASFMDTTYLALFINFFLKSYVLRGGKAKYQSRAKDPKKVE
ncbi:hypothetical protein WR25_27306 [Diploscapter pachys]|uniref:Elongation of very long chain fatty acids protein n=1 Tax=Diploscapter pachys TaxID=2018661 RepID=A0A2A2K628_9BILA|nr:hypothetical protein WR25_27306 [Diploscapter pachys]